MLYISIFWNSPQGDDQLKFNFFIAIFQHQKTDVKEPMQLLFFTSGQVSALTWLSLVLLGIFFQNISCQSYLNFVFQEISFQEIVDFL